MTPQARAALNLDLRDVMFMQNAAEPIRVSTVSVSCLRYLPAVRLPFFVCNMQVCFDAAIKSIGCRVAKIVWHAKSWPLALKR